jgi:hypothetical protein
MPPIVWAVQKIRRRMVAVLYKLICGRANIVTLG